MKKILPKLKPLICLLLCIVAVITFTCIAFSSSESSSGATEKPVLNIWQVDNFEGGKGSRADYIKRIGEEFSKKNSCYLNVTAISADAVRLNLAEGNFPDIISYGAGIYGIEQYVQGYQTWCHGGYCFLTLDGDFSDLTEQNTVINEGKDNFASAAALACGIPEAVQEKSTGAYVKLINGDYKYLLGTQRDIYRLKTRAVSFSVKPITEYNDLFQNVSVLTQSKNKTIANNFISYLISKQGELNKIGMMYGGQNIYEDEMKIMEGLSYECKLISPVSKDTHDRIQKIIKDKDVNMLKNLLK